MDKEFYNYIPPSFDIVCMKQVYLAAERSLDPRTKIGAVLVKERNVIGTGYNGFPRKVLDLPERYNDRSIKLSLIVHAEHNSILTCARLGISTLDSVLYTNGVPCKNCSSAIIQAGIKEIVVHKQWPNLTYNEEWVKSIEISNMILKEANINIRWLDSVLGVKCYLNGKIINV